jgi:acetyltransferase-like isoleucine patch superfamily enzyme
MVTIGSNCKLKPSVNITIGRNTRICDNVTIDMNRALFASNINKSRKDCVVAAGVVIGENCYVGASVTIVSPVTINTGAIIHPGSVVSSVSCFRHFTVAHLLCACCLIGI